MIQQADAFHSFSVHQESLRRSIPIHLIKPFARIANITSVQRIIEAVVSERVRRDLFINQKLRVTVIFNLLSVEPIILIIDEITKIFPEG